MIGVLLITHERLGAALLDTATHILGSQPSQVGFLDVPAGTDPRDLVPSAQISISRVDAGNGVLILTDIFGASPSNLACNLVVSGRIEAVSGVNVPMILRALSSRNSGWPHLLKRVVGGGCEGVFRIEVTEGQGPCSSATLAGQLKESAAT